jgi:alkylation response protein AidB-like acyl-CoA dehydrogenase
VGDELDAAIDAFLADVPDDVTALRGRLFDHGLAWLGPRDAAHLNARLHAAGVSVPTTAAMGVGVGLAGPTMAAHGSPALCERLLRRAFTGEDAWCQLFSEPVSGSDMAGLATRAERDGDVWVVTGQKVWTTNAHLANRGLLIARSDPDRPKHKGITYFALDLTLPGVEVRPLRQLTGQAEFSEVFLTEVRVPDDDRIGDVGDGWRVAMTTLSNERTVIGGGGGGRPPARGSGAIAEAVRLYQEAPRPDLRDRLIALWCQAEVLRLTNQRRSAVGGGSMSKLAFATLNQRVYELCVDLLGAGALVGADYAMRREDHLGYVGPPGSARQYFLRTRANTIEGGTTEIQKSIVGERVLGLPPEPRVDKDIPWKDVPR